MGETELIQRLDSLKKRLTKLVYETGTLVHPSVVAVSQELNDVIVTIQRRRLKTAKR